MALRTNGSKIRELRERKAMTIVEFAERIGYAMNSVWTVEVGERNGGKHFIRAACEVLGCEIEDIATYVPDGETAERRSA